MRLGVAFDDSILRLNSVIDRELLGTTFHSDKFESPYTLFWDNGASRTNYTSNGEIVVLQFEILSETNGSPINLSYNNDWWDIFDLDYNLIEFTINNGSISNPPEDNNHNYVSDVAIPATCVDEGLMTYTCAVCGDSYTEPIEKDPANHTGGTYENVITPATLTTDGLMGIYCAGCGELIETYPIPATISDTDPLLSVSSSLALHGTAASVDISIANNPGFAGMVLKVSYPEELELVQYALGDVDLLSGFTGPDGVPPGEACSISDSFYLVWGRTSDYTQDGAIATLTFAVDPDTKPGEYPIIVTFEQHNGPRIPVDYQEQPLDISIKNGAIIVISYILGNVTDSGEVGLADLVRLARWIAGHGVFINELAADVNGDDEIGPADLVRLSRWIAGHFGGLTLEELLIK